MITKVFTGILNRFIFDRVCDSWILSFLLFTLGSSNIVVVVVIVELLMN